MLQNGVCCAPRIHNALKRWRRMARSNPTEFAVSLPRRHRADKQYAYVRRRSADPARTSAHLIWPALAMSGQCSDAHNSELVIWRKSQFQPFHIFLDQCAGNI